MQTAEEKKAYMRKWYLEHKKEIQEYREAHKDQKSLYNKQYSKKHRTKLTARKRQWNLQNTEHRKAYSKAYRAANKEKIRTHKKEFYDVNAEKLRAKAKTWRDKNLDRARESNKKWKKENALLVAEALKAWYKFHPESKRSYDAKRKSAKKKINGTYTADDLKRLMTLQGGRCAICKGVIQEEYHADHIVPLARGGSNDWKNIQITHPTCNQQKYTKDPILFMQEKGFLL